MLYNLLNLHNRLLDVMYIVLLMSTDQKESYINIFVRFLISVCHNKILPNLYNYCNIIYLLIVNIIIYKLIENNNCDTVI